MKLRSDGIAHRLAQNPIDLGLGPGIEPPAGHLPDGLQLARMVRAPDGS